MRWMCAVAITSAIVLGGCAKGAPISTIADVKLDDRSASGVDAFAGRRQRGEKVPDFKGDHLVTIRTYAKDTRRLLGRGDEIVGASCRVKGTGYSASVKTPAKVRVPLYGNASTEIAVTCRAAGFQQQAQSVRAYNKTKADRRNAVASTGGLGLGVALVSTVAVLAVNAAFRMKQTTSSPTGTSSWCCNPTSRLPIASSREAANEFQTSS